MRVQRVLMPGSEAESWTLLGRVSWILKLMSCMSLSVLDRHDLLDEEWERLEPLLPRNPGRGGRWADHRRTINGVFWRTRTGCPWRDLPEQYGKWQTVYKRHRRWSMDGTWAKVLDGLRAGCDENEGRDWTVSADSTIARAHQHAAGAAREPARDDPAGGGNE